MLKCHVEGHTAGRSIVGQAKTHTQILRAVDDPLKMCMGQTDLSVFTLLAKNSEHSFKTH